MLIAKHIPVLQVLIPFFAALLSTLISKPNVGKIIAIIAIIVNTGISIYGILILSGSISYSFGNWGAPIGIEYRLDHINQPIIIYANCILLFFLTASSSLLQTSIFQFIASHRQHLFYSILLFAHTGYIGIISTNDLFNLYVFIEISSLSAFVLMAQGNNPKSVIGAFDYLMLGTIGATLILIGIGFLLSATGSLNISDIHQRLSGLYSSKIVISGTCFILTGCLLKIAFFPMHFWMIKSYMSAPAIILAYLGSISTVIGSYMCIRFIYFVIEYHYISQIIANFIMPLALLTIILCSWFACSSDKIKKIIIYGAAAQIGYVVLLLTINADGVSSILYQLLFVDGINKTALFLIVAYIEANHPVIVTSKTSWYIIITTILICSSGLPPSPMFIIKIKILDLLINYNKWLEFFVIIAGSALALIYHYKIAALLFFTRNEEVVQ